jgi:hypothetical protein
MTVIINGTTGIDTVQDGIVTDAKLNLTANSQEIKDALNATGSAPIYACRAWVNFNGTGTVAIRASGNVSSITDSGTGNYTVNFTTAMPDVNYSFNGTTSDDATAGAVVYSSGTWATNGLVGSIKIRTVNNSFSATDRTVVAVSVFR